MKWLAQGNTEIEMKGKQNMLCESTNNEIELIEVMRLDSFSDNVLK